MNIDAYTHKIVEEAGWVIECESPLEVSNGEGGFARYYPAQLLIEELLKEHEMEHREQNISEYSELNRRYIEKEIEYDEYIEELKKLTNIGK